MASTRRGQEKNSSLKKSGTPSPAPKTPSRAQLSTAPSPRTITLSPLDKFIDRVTAIALPEDQLNPNQSAGNEEAKKIMLALQKAAIHVYRNLLPVNIKDSKKDDSEANKNWNRFKSIFGNIISVVEESWQSEYKITGRAHITYIKNDFIPSTKAIHIDKLTMLDVELAFRQIMEACGIKDKKTWDKVGGGVPPIELGPQALEAKHVMFCITAALPDFVFSRAENGDFSIKHCADVQKQAKELEEKQIHIARQKEIEMLQLQQKKDNEEKRLREEQESDKKLREIAEQEEKRNLEAIRIHNERMGHSFSEEQNPVNVAIRKDVTSFESNLNAMVTAMDKAVNFFTAANKESLDLVGDLKKQKEFFSQHKTEYVNNLLKLLNNLQPSFTKIKETFRSIDGKEKDLISHDETEEVEIMNFSDILEKDEKKISKENAEAVKKYVQKPLKQVYSDLYLPILTEMTKISGRYEELCNAYKDKENYKFKKDMYFDLYTKINHSVTKVFSDLGIQLGSYDDAYNEYNELASKPRPSIFSRFFSIFSSNKKVAPTTDVKQSEQQLKNMQEVTRYLAQLILDDKAVAARGWGGMPIPHKDEKGEPVLNKDKTPHTIKISHSAYNVRAHRMFVKFQKEHKAWLLSKDSGAKGPGQHDCRTVLNIIVDESEKRHAEQGRVKFFFTPRSKEMNLIHNLVERLCFLDEDKKSPSCWDTNKKFNVCKLDYPDMKLIREMVNKVRPDIVTGSFVSQKAPGIK